VEIIVTNGRAEGAQILEDLLESGEDELAPADTTRTTRLSGSTAQAAPESPREPFTCSTI
jgi:hypothetical protein